MYTMVDCRSCTSPVQSTSQNPLKAQFEVQSTLQIPMTCFMAIQWCGLAFNINWLTIQTANAISALVPTIAYMKDPTLALYETPFIFLCVFLNSSLENFNNFNFASNRVLTGLHRSMLNMLKDLLNVAPLVHGDGTSFFISLKLHS